MPSSHVTDGPASSVLSGSAAPRAFCVVCGAYRDDLAMRKSGLKCPSCVGKRANRQWARLQKRQASQLYGEFMTQQLGGSASGRGQRLSYTFGSLASTSSSVLSSTEEVATTSTSHSPAEVDGRAPPPPPGTANPIRAYVDSTAAYLHAVEEQGAAGGACLALGSFDSMMSPLSGAGLEDHGAAPASAPPTVVVPPPPPPRHTPLRHANSARDGRTAPAVPKRLCGSSRTLRGGSPPLPPLTATEVCEPTPLSPPPPAPVPARAAHTDGIVVAEMALPRDAEPDRSARTRSDSVALSSSQPSF
ncbi:WAS/WASL-interacting protein family member 2 [Strigomonas culicis]|uniref:WAS/WASL-interacting protein family member 2 n=1 Tax=Strigomonas culicis TaxID=28005 RepID=S9TEZ8_9TRYP|nr:WAS/WASL-interacting protein family member 2 [Strigomonas culicis]|eukprot:EPY16597.1 WAS/WASL-interacting protein family member 2 [Strigomonas culicis]